MAFFLLPIGSALAQQAALLEWAKATGPNLVSYSVALDASGTVFSTGYFLGTVDFDPGAGCYGVALGDLDGDGKTDMAVSNYTAGTVSVLRNTSVSSIIDSGQNEKAGR